MVLTVYGILPSPPVRAVLLTCKALGLPVQLEQVNLMQGEHFQETYIKKNPQHTVPTLDDDGFIIWDSHAICTYLISKYGKNDSLYPKDLQKRAIVDQRLHFDSGILFPRMRGMFFPIIFKGAKSAPTEKLDEMHEGLAFLEAFFDNKEWVAGSDMTVADLCIVTVISSLESAFDLIDPSRYPRITAWYKRMKTLPYYEETNNVGAQMVGQMIKEKMNS